MKNTSINLILLLLLFSCNNKVNSTLEGGWLIEEFYHNKYDVKYCANRFIDFEENRAKLPGSNYRCEGIYNFGTPATWEVSQTDSNLVIKFISKDGVLNGDYVLCFWEDEYRGVLQMSIESKETYIVATKLIYDSGNHKGDISFLIRASNCVR